MNDKSTVRISGSIRTIKNAEVEYSQVFKAFRRAFITSLRDDNAIDPQLFLDTSHTELVSFNYVILFEVESWEDAEKYMLKALKAGADAARITLVPSSEYLLEPTDFTSGRLAYASA